MTSLINIIVVALSILVVSQEANASCFFKPPFKCKYTNLPTLAYKFKLPSLPKPPTFLPCPRPATKVTNKPDVNIPLPLPSEIPVGRFCTCQKYSIKPTVVPCIPASEAPVSVPVPFAAPVQFAAPVPFAPPVQFAAPAPLTAVPPMALSPDILQAILASVVAPAAAAAPPCACSCV